MVNLRHGNSRGNFFWQASPNLLSPRARNIAAPASATVTMRGLGLFAGPEQ
jgi:hypothetical protein